MPTGIDGVDLIPANIDLSAGEVQLINEVGREHTLARALRPVLHAYDYVLIDCQPSLGLLTVNALACAHGVIIPLAAEYFSLRGVHLLVDTIAKVQERINPDLSVEGVLITMYDGRTVHAREVVGMLHQRFGDTVFDTVIGRTVKFPETTVAGEPITSYAPDIAGGAGVPGARPGSDRAMTVPRRQTGAGSIASAPVESDSSPAAALDPPSPTPLPPTPRRCPRDAGAFHVRLDNFDGPFDLLLQLINQRRMDVTEVALHQVTDDFIAHIRSMGSNWDLDQVTEFLVIAATLLDLKAARLLPDATADTGMDDDMFQARDLLFARLLAYRAYQQVAALFAELEAGALRRYPRAVTLESRYLGLLPEITDRHDAGAVRRDGGVGVPAETTADGEPGPHPRLPGIGGRAHRRPAGAARRPRHRDIRRTGGRLHRRPWRWWPDSSGC